MSRFFSAMFRNYRVFPGKSVPIPGEISRFSEQFWLCPETAFVRVVTPRTVSQTTVSTGPIKMFRLEHETMNAWFVQEM